MAQQAQHYAIFKTEGGFCGIAWNSIGITRFQLPTSSADGTERLLLRRVPDAEPATPTPDIAEAIAAVKRYFAGEPIDFSDLALDLAGQDDFFRDIYAAARRLRWGETTTYGALAKEPATAPKPPATSARPWPRTPSR